MRRFISIIFLLVAIGLLVGAWTQYQRAEDLIATGDQVTGTVVSFRTTTDSEGDTSYALIYRFTHDGAERSYSPNATSSSRPEIGSTTTLYVDPDDPTDVLADSFMDRWFLPVLLGGIGAVLLVVSLATMAAGRSARRAASGPHSWSPPSDEPVTRTASPEATVDVDIRSEDAGPFVGRTNKGPKSGPFL